MLQHARECPFTRTLLHVSAVPCRATWMNMGMGACTCTPLLHFHVGMLCTHGRTHYVCFGMKAGYCPIGIF